MSKKLPVLEQAIRAILAKDFPLPAREIRSRLTEKYGYLYSVSGVQTSLRELTAAGILHKQGPRYELNIQNLMYERDGLQAVIERYTQPKGHHLFRSQEQRYTFQTLEALDRFWNQLIQKWFVFYPEKSDSYLQFQPFPWFAFMHFDEERRIIDHIGYMCRTCETLVLNNNYITSFQELYQRDNIKLWTTADRRAATMSFAVYKDHSIQFIYPPQICKAIEQMTAPGFPERSIFKIIKPFFDQGSYELIISKDWKLADKLRRKMELLKQR